MKVIEKEMRDTGQDKLRQKKEIDKEKILSKIKNNKRKT